MSLRPLHRRFPMLPVLLLLAGLTQSARADDDLGPVSNGAKPGPGFTNLPDTLHLYRRPDGTLYEKKPGGDNIFNVGPGTTVNTADGKQYMTPAPGQGAPQNFDQDLRVWIQNEENNLSIAVPTAGQTFYSLALPPTLDAEGNQALADPLSDTPSVVTGIVGLDQGLSMLSVLGSSTADGLTPILFDYNPSVTALALSLSLDPSSMQFIDGGVYTPPPALTYDVFSQETPEPMTLVMVALGCAGLIGFQRKTT